MTNPHAWFLRDLDQVPKNGLKVMSTFACGGGSSMGYKLAGCDVIAANDIDPEMAYHYKLNLKPKHYFLCPIHDLLTAELPDELFNLDILDGSPPCSSFSTSGVREKTWGKKKHFREGQAKQVLSDLFFDYLDLVEYLKPKVAIAENVKGMILGKAKGYVKLVMKRFKEIGYRPQLFLINAANCGVPQDRERIFFCAVRKDIEVPKLELNPKVPWINVKAATADLQVLTADEKQNTKPTDEGLRYWGRTTPGKRFADTKRQLGEKESSFNRCRLHGDKPARTLVAGASGGYYHWSECRRLTYREWIRIGSFPDDYRAKTSDIGKYMIGMSVPPKMTQAVATAVIEQWFNHG